MPQKPDASPARPVLIALTGSIGMGKSATAQLFAREGCAFYDADAAVHRLYAAGGAAVAAVGRLVPAARQGGAIDRKVLARALREQPAQFAALERIVHPLVRADRARFLKTEARRGTRFAVLDVPLLFETGADADSDYTVVATTSAEKQRQRVLARPHMTAEAFASLLSRQMPDAEKRKRADFLVDTSHGLEAAHRQVKKILAEIVRREARKTSESG